MNEDMAERLNTATEPRTEDHEFDPSCPCRDCHLEAEAEDATWD